MCPSGSGVRDLFTHDRYDLGQGDGGEPRRWIDARRLWIGGAARALVAARWASMAGTWVALDQHRDVTRSPGRWAGQRQTTACVDAPTMPGQLANQFRDRPLAVLR